MRKWRSGPFWQVRRISCSQARSGAAINDTEHQRLLNELPNEGNDPKVFKARLANTVRQFKNLYKTQSADTPQDGPCHS